MEERIERSTIPLWLLLGFGISSIGGPLALVSLYLRDILGASTQYLLPASVLAVILFLFPIIAWYNYSKKIASSGGLYEFVRRSVGERVARVQGVLWILSYLLYLPYTVTYIVFYILPAIFPLSPVYLYLMEVFLPVVLCALVFSGKKPTLVFLSFIAIIQMILVVVLSAYISSHVGLSIAPIGKVNPFSLSTVSLGVSGLFVCSSLLLFLGGEAEGGAESIRRGLVYSFIVASLLLILFALASSSVYTSVSKNEAPGFTLALLYANAAFAYLLGIFALLIAN